ncbi:hypothetical protein M1I50_09380 [Clostridioides difficile]|uniref:hypothetical protein n=1 Tax=Clostridioides difficile TaxID=1496 RepID=UPI00131CDAD3|nr:hypothetical protein [Clostridioides difficile]EIS9524125.1 hypothetical protein [Clostridioides difficile]EIS9625702.1 hypothetical protein [Clostridioides difficile]MBY1968890.1 hypothetical protein [Clostridioides difficile]MBZ4494569.1 hypothetical protein [Clostridioides difficile]MCL0943194.1 hypothetical protein [Clostridioides difficile]
MLQIINNIEDCELLIETEIRMKYIDGKELISQSDILKDLNIDEKDLEDVEVNFE